MKGSGPWIAGAVLIVLVCMAAGCTGSKGSSGGSNAAQGGGGNSDGSSTGGNYLHDVYISVDCTGDWDQPGPVEVNHHGSFSVTGNIPIPVNYDYHDVPAAAYCSKTDNMHVLHITGESWQNEIMDDNTWQPCHYVWDGYANAQACINYGSVNPASKWTVINLASGRDLGRTNSFQMEGRGCSSPITAEAAAEEIYSKTHRCLTSKQSALPFVFSDGSKVTIPPPDYYDELHYSDFNQNVVFHIGKAPDAVPSASFTIPPEETLPPLVPPTTA